MAGCCVFLWRPSSSPRIGYRHLGEDGEEAIEPSSPVTVVVGKEKRVFLVEQFVLDKYPFRVLLEMVMRKERKGGGAIFVDVDAILFEHILWLACNERSPAAAFSLVQLDLKEIIEFYSQDV